MTLPKIETPAFQVEVPSTKEKVTMSLSAEFGSINDTNMKISVSIRNEDYEVLHFLPDSSSTILSLKRTDYPDPKLKTTWALLFSRGEWKEQ